MQSNYRTKGKHNNDEILYSMSMHHDINNAILDKRESISDSRE